MEKRLLIFCFYSKTRRVSEDVILLLKQLRAVAYKIVFVVNGHLVSDVSDYVDEIIVRENVGLDFGAYKDVISTYNLDQYDEVILCNDTFYGFFAPLEEIFKTMEDRNCEMWGLNKVERGLLNHVQSYFLVFKNKGIKTMNDYFINSPMVNSFGQDVAFMEPRLYRYFVNNGHKVDSYVDTKCVDVYANPIECIKKYGLPILKKKSFESSHCSRDLLEETLDYIKSNNLYMLDIDNNNSSNSKTVRNKWLANALISEEEILNWISVGAFYIFGNGVVANEIYYTYIEGNPLFKGFVLSKKEKLDNVYSIVEIPSEARIIVAVRPETQNEVIGLLPKSMTILKLWEV